MYNGNPRINTERGIGTWRQSIDSADMEFDMHHRAHSHFHSFTEVLKKENYD